MMTKPNPSSMRKRWRSERGGAMVEFSVLMLIFVPLILLPLYFQDALRYKLDTQEAIYSASWDFAYMDYGEKTIGDVKHMVEEANKRIYKNLWPSNEDDKPDPAGPWADFKWIEEINCGGDTGFAAQVYAQSQLAGIYHGAYTKGGLASCKGAISVRNHYIPTHFVEGATGFTETELWEHGRDWMDYETINFGVMVDSWTINNGDDINPFGAPLAMNPFYQRANLMWRMADKYSDVESKWESFASKMSDKFSQDQGTLEDDFDNPMVLKLASLHLADEKRSIPAILSAAVSMSGLWVTPFEDGDGDVYKSTFEARDEYYLGCTSFQPNCQ